MYLWLVAALALECKKEDVSELKGTGGACSREPPAPSRAVNKAVSSDSCWWPTFLDLEDFFRDPILSPTCKHQSHAIGAQAFGSGDDIHHAEAGHQAGGTRPAESFGIAEENGSCRNGMKIKQL